MGRFRLFSHLAVCNCEQLTVINQFLLCFYLFFISACVGLVDFNQMESTVIEGEILTTHFQEGQGRVISFIVHYITLTVLTMLGCLFSCSVDGALENVTSTSKGVSEKSLS